jgi:hypothetical protein
VGAILGYLLIASIMSYDGDDIEVDQMKIVFYENKVIPFIVMLVVMICWLGFAVAFLIEYFIGVFNNE